MVTTAEQKVRNSADSTGTKSATAAPVDPYRAFSAALINSGKLQKAELNRAKRFAGQGDDEPLSTLLVKLGMVSEKDVAQVLSDVSGFPLVGLNAYPDVSPLKEGIALRFLKQHKMIGLEDRGTNVILAMSDPLNQFAIDAMSLACGKPISPCVGIASEIESAMERQYGGGKSQMDQLVDTLDNDDEVGEEDVEHLKDLASEAPVIRMVNLIFQKAMESRASDIHVEPFEQQLKVRFRVDGVLRDVEAPPVRSTAAVISRIKIMSKLNIAERRLPQDGRIKIQIQGKELDLRVSTIPTMYGESVVIRLLDKENIVLDFDTLGFEGKALGRFLEILAQPHGIILITGPTGSGKSTTLYTALHKLNTPERKIITVEDPVEYQLAGVNQIQAKSQIGLTFASALRSIVRQDPDVIMIGEMRDLETARIAVQAALTGHLVLSTLHTNDAAGGVTRLLDMGLEDYLITSTVNGILAQRLVRKLCDDCKQPYTALPEVVEEMRLGRFVEDGEVTLYRPKGCSKCGGVGYLGRMSIIEFLVMTDSLRRLIMGHSEANKIQELAMDEGMDSMYDDGLRKAVAGETTVEEILRVTTDA